MNTTTDLRQTVLDVLVELSDRTGVEIPESDDEQVRTLDLCVASIESRRKAGTEHWRQSPPVRIGRRDLVSRGTTLRRDPARPRPE